MNGYDPDVPPVRPLGEAQESGQGHSEAGHPMRARPEPSRPAWKLVVRVLAGVLACFMLIIPAMIMPWGLVYLASNTEESLGLLALSAALLIGGFLLLVAAVRR
jgi:hypothetical protein